MTNDKQRERLVELISSVETVEDITVEPIACNRLADYLLANGVIVPPCKVGDKVYILKDGKVTNYFVLEISKHYNGTMYFETVPQDVRGCPQWFNVSNRFTDKNIGKTVFLTREEAEKALGGGVQG